MKKIFLILCFVFELSGVCSAGWYVNTDYRFNIFLPDEFIVVSPKQDNDFGVVVMNGIDKGRGFTLSVRVAYFDKEEVAGQALEIAKNTMKQFIVGKGFVVLQEGYFNVAPCHNGIFMKVGSQNGNETLENIYAWCWIHGKFFAIHFVSEKKQNLSQFLLKTLNTFTCTQHI